LTDGLVPLSECLECSSLRRVKPYEERTRLRGATFDEIETALCSPRGPPAGGSL